MRGQGGHRARVHGLTQLAKLYLPDMCSSIKHLHSVGKTPLQITTLTGRCSEPPKVTLDRLMQHKTLEKDIEGDEGIDVGEL